MAQSIRVEGSAFVISALSLHDPLSLIVVSDLTLVHPHLQSSDTEWPVELELFGGRWTARPHEHSERQLFTLVAEQVLVHRSENVMATAEQMQDALQQLQVLGASIAALEALLQIESARAQTAQQERSALIQSLAAMRQERAGGLVETKGISQPFTLKGGADPDSCVRSCLQGLGMRFSLL